MNSVTVHSKVCILFSAVLALSSSKAIADYLIYEEDPINYSDTKTNDPISKMVLDYEAGKLGLDSSNEKAFLQSLLNKLSVPVESQVLVFSRTSFQNDYIRPQRPRAIYFSENLYIGWVQGGDIEIIAIDAQLGPVFYRMITPFGRNTQLSLRRSGQCLNCHGSSRTGGYPGMLVRSVYPNSIGMPILSAGTRLTDHSSLLNHRWGGWFVTGEAAGARHLGNIYYEESKTRDAVPVMDYGASLKSLEKAFDTSKYLTDTSDIVGLMVMEHQVMAHNAITRAHLNTRRWLHLDEAIAKQTDRPKGKLSTATLGYIDHSAKELLQVLLFTDEVKLDVWGVEGSKAFQQDFVSKGRRDANGNSLRDLQLLSRLFKNRLSYMIHSSSFEHLHPLMKKTFYKKLWEALNEADKDGISSHLKVKERQRIVSILLATKKDLPAYWSSSKL